MKTKLKLLLVLPLVAVLMFTSCQKEEIDITQPNENEAIVADSELAKLVEATSKQDGSKDDVVDGARCFTLKLPVVIHIGNDRNIQINTEADFVRVQEILKQYNYTREQIEFNFPIKVVMANYEEVEINSVEDFKRLVYNCNGEVQEEEHIRCIDFKFPISFSIYNSDSQVVDVVTIEGKRELYYFMQRVRNSEVIARLNFPVTMKLANGTEIAVNSHLDLKNTIHDAREACVGPDIIKDRIVNYLQQCLWRVDKLFLQGVRYESDYIGTPLKFFPDNIVKLRVNGEFIQGTYEVMPLPGVEEGFKLKIMIDGRPNLALYWYGKIMGADLMEFHLPNDPNSGLVLERLCPTFEVDEDILFVNRNLINGLWNIALLEARGDNMAEFFLNHTLEFKEAGKVILRNPNNVIVPGFWESFRSEGLHLALFFGENIPFNDLNHRWKIVEVTATRIVLVDLNSTGGVERKLILEKRI
jgi:hypothetical protein